MALARIGVDEFTAALAAAPASPAFREAAARIDIFAFSSFLPADAFISRGPMSVEGTFDAPAGYTLVIGSLRAKLHLGNDVWISVGDGALVEYGVGYCMLMEDRRLQGTVIEPRHDEDATVAALAIRPDPDYEYVCYQPDAVRDVIRAGRPLFR